MEKTLIEKMKDYAFKMHDMPSDCQRYGAEPYSKHLEDVRANALRYMYYIAEEAQEDVDSASTGHDLLEDTATSPSDIEKLFNFRIADIIFRVTNERGFSRKERNFATYPKIWVNDLAIFVKLCDRIANTRNSKETGYKMYKTYKAEYPVFRYALKVRNLYPDMWNELDELNDYKEC